MVLCTNGVLFPRRAEKLHTFLEKLGQPLLIKLSVNHHLLERDPGLLDLACGIRHYCETHPECRLVLNVRRRKDANDEDQWILHDLEQKHLLDISNDFFLQRYGLASDESAWDLPFVVHDQFTMINPDGEIFAGDLISRSEAMGSLK